jgi:hypothetical protein
MPVPERLKRLEPLVTAFGNASFACGEWNDDYDETYDEVLAQCKKAEDELWAAIERETRPPYQLGT